MQPYERIKTATGRRRLEGEFTKISKGQIGETLLKIGETLLKIGDTLLMIREALLNTHASI